MNKLRVVAGALVASLALGFGGAGAAMADDKVTTGGELTIAKTMTVTEGSSIPAASFSFDIKPAEVDEDTKADGLRVEKGQDLTNTDNITATFSGTEQLEDKDGKKVATATTATYNFGSKDNVDYTNHENTVQRYVVSEKDTTVAGVTKDDKRYLLDVYVGEDGSVKYLVGYNTEDGKKLGEKAPIVFNNTYASESLTITKTVVDTTGFKDAGAQFDFTLTVNVPEGSGVTTLSAQTLSPKGTLNNPALVTPNQEVTFKLGDGDKFVVTGLPEGSTYSVDETNAEGYKTKVSVDGQEQGTAALTDQRLTDSDSVVFTNTRDAITPTGVVMAVAPYVVALAVVAGAGAWFVVRRVKKQQA